MKQRFSFAVAWLKVRSKFLQFGCNFSGVISMVEQDGNLRDVHRFGTKVIEVMAQQFNQALVIADIGFRAMGEKRQA